MKATRYSLRTLLILTILGPPAIALEWWYWKESSHALLALEVVGLYLILWVLYLILWLMERMYGALCQLIGVKPRSVRANDSNQNTTLRGSAASFSGRQWT